MYAEHRSYTATERSYHTHDHSTIKPMQLNRRNTHAEFMWEIFHCGSAHILTLLLLLFVDLYVVCMGSNHNYYSDCIVLSENTIHNMPVAVEARWTLCLRLPHYSPTTLLLGLAGFAANKAQSQRTSSCAHLRQPMCNLKNIRRMLFPIAVEWNPVYAFSVCMNMCDWYW